MENPLNYKPLHECLGDILILVLDVREHDNHPNDKYYE